MVRIDVDKNGIVVDTSAEDVADAFRFTVSHLFGEDGQAWDTSGMHGSGF